MIRAVVLAIGKEFRLLRRDPVGLFMLLVAPIAVIAAAGFSLSNIYGGGSSSFTVAVVNEDGGEVAHAMIGALRQHHLLKVVDVANREIAAAMVRKHKQAVVAIVIPAGTTTAFLDGSSPRLVLYTDPVRYLQTVKVELALSEVNRRISVAANERARRQLASARQRLESDLAEATRGIDQARASAQQFAHDAQHSRSVAEAQLRGQIDAAISSSRAQTEKALDEAIRQISAQAKDQIASQRALLSEARDFLQRLKEARAAFEKWFAELSRLAGSRASSIPPPPSFPEPPKELLALEDTAPAMPDFAALRARLEQSIVTPQIDVRVPNIAMPPIPEISKWSLPPNSGSAVVPGTIGLADLDSAQTGFNAFDLQVPGFAVTFLLIGMLMGVSLALIDENDWGTLNRLRTATAPLGATFAGKLLARFAVGFLQMTVLFAAGWVFFGISLGNSPWALAMPSASIAFAGAAFGLVVAGIGGTRDAVLPVGAIVIMTMAAIGGCWWPIDFEPHWMQTAALAMPTTWAMSAYNDLMIRGLSPSSAFVPSAVNMGFGLVYMAFGIAISRRRFAP